jgi:hypothetical protein
MKCKFVDYVSFSWVNAGVEDRGCVASCRQTNTLIFGTAYASTTKWRVPYRKLWSVPMINRLLHMLLIAHDRASNAQPVKLCIYFPLSTPVKDFEALRPNGLL